MVQTSFSLGWGRGVSDAVKTLLIINGIVFLLQMLTGPAMILYLGLVPRWAWTRLFLWQFITYMFLHGDFFHILFNMYALWFFGGALERMWGSKAFYKYYFITGIGAGLFYGILNMNSIQPTIGASGAVYGVLAAFALMFPHAEIALLFPPVRLRARTLAMIMAGIALFLGLAGSRDNVAHLAHLGGMLVGYIYLKRGLDLKGIQDRFRHWNRRRRMRVIRRREEEKERLRRLVDQVLDKANEVGLENLSRDEKVFLKRASKILNKERQ
ncbi:MAG TPA: rhomboid family intramembrane serine protease [bacterium]|nr:rhomboid family intramembrane serine protease [bacterium]